ncbi:MAG TPA: AMP-binding protein [Pedomonas sp.]|uniref:class I adenylate-forming enzyme family protein n=1 Tax=Pedomonas sp. TaxID=2976421 RepID=UPI002F4170C4
MTLHSHLRREVHYGRVVSAHSDRPGTVLDMLSAAVASAPERTAVVDGALRLTYAEVDGHVATCAAALASYGVKAGDRVALLLANRADVLVLMLAAARIGAITVPMNIRQKPPETAYALNASGAILLCHEAGLAGELPLPEDVPALRHCIAVDDDLRIWQHAAVQREPAEAEPSEEMPFCILYTSGTTGRPKGALITHLGVLTSVLGAQQTLGLEDGEVTVMPVPASHITGIVLQLMLTLRVAGTLILMREFKARRFLEIASREGMTFTSMVPAMYVLCLMDDAYDSFDLSHWRVGTFGGAPMPDSVIADLARRNPALRLSNIYGATETTSPAVIMPAAETAERSHQVGRPLPYCELLIMDDEGREVPRGQQGEIWIAGPMVIPCYWNDPEATASAFVGGHWRSGDIGSLDEDGFLQLFDRKKDMINRGGFKIYSVEVENVLASHPSVIEVGVVGRPCPVLGERSEAFVYVREAIADDALRAYCAARLSDYKIPDAFTILSEALPRNANGKLLKTALREQAMARLQKTGTAAS